MLGKNGKFEEWTLTITENKVSFFPIFAKTELQVNKKNTEEFKIELITETIRC